MTSSLLDHLWQSTLFAAGSAVLAAALRGNRAHVRYSVWLAASLKFLVPFGLLTAAGGRLASALAADDIAIPAGRVVARAIGQIAQPFSGLLPRATAPAWVAIDPPVLMLVCAWACGSALLVWTRLRARRRIRAVVRASTPLTLAAAGPCGKDIEVRSSPGLLEPGVVGIRSPTLLMPVGLEKRLPIPQLEALLAHELCHVRRRDNLTAAIHMVVETVFWFHPAVWWIGARLVEERERACDEEVLRGQGDPRAYAEVLLHVCRSYVESPLASVCGMTGSDLRKRIEDIMDNQVGQELSNIRRTALCLAAAAALVGPVLVGLAAAPADGQSPERPGQLAQARQVKEAALKAALLQLRQGIDQYHADLRQYPPRLGALVSRGYVRKIPADPFTGRTDTWQTVSPKPAASGRPGEPGIFDVRSGSRRRALDGSSYSHW